MSSERRYPYKRCGSCWAADSLIKHASGAWMCTACDEWDPVVIVVRKAKAS